MNKITLAVIFENLQIKVLRKVQQKINIRANHSSKVYCSFSCQIPAAADEYKQNRKIVFSVEQKIIPMLDLEPADEPCSQSGSSSECHGLKRCGTLFGILSCARFHKGDMNTTFLRCAFRRGFADSISQTFSLHKLCMTSPHLVPPRNFPQENQYHPLL